MDSFCFLCQTLTPYLKNGVFRMASTKRRVRRDWSKQDLGQLRTLARRKTPARVIGRRLRRSEGAVRQKAFSLGVSLDTRARRRRK